MLCMLMVYPLGWIMNLCLKGALIRHLFATIFGIIIQIYMYRDQVVHVFAMTLVTYFLMNVLPRNQQHKAVFVFVLGYMSAQHIQSMLTNFGGWDLNVTTYTMILAAKFSALGFCYKDGGEKEENLLPEQKERKVVKMPSPLEMLSYVFFVCGCVCGPFFEYSDYINFIEQKGHYAHVPVAIGASLKRLFHGFCKYID